MIFYCLLLACGDISTAPIDHKKKGFFEASLISFHELDGHLLAVGPMDNLLVLFDSQGKEIARLEESQPAGAKLAVPTIMGITENRILVVSNGKDILVFDHGLKPVEASYPPLQMMIMSGRHLKADEFMLYTFGNEEHALTHVALENGAWQKKGALMPVVFSSEEPNQPAMPTSWVAVQGDLAFAWTPIVMGEDRYHIDVFDTAGISTAEQVLVFENRIDDLRGFTGSWPYLMMASPYGDRYAVLVLLADPTTFAFQSRWLDIFSEQGDFKERREIDKNTELKPVAGTRRLLAMNTTSLLLEKYP